MTRRIVCFHAFVNSLAKLLIGFADLIESDQHIEVFKQSPVADLFRHIMEFSRFKKVVHGLFFKTVCLHQLSLRNMALFFFAKLPLVVPQGLAELYWVQVQALCVFTDLAAQAV